MKYLTGIVVVLLVAAVTFAAFRIGDMTGRPNPSRACFSYGGQTRCLSDAQAQQLRQSVTRANAAIRRFNQEQQQYAAPRP